MLAEERALKDELETLAETPRGRERGDRSGL